MTINVALKFSFLQQYKEEEIRKSQKGEGIIDEVAMVSNLWH